MRGKMKSSLLLILIIQLAILSCAFGGTYAKYSTSFTGTASAKVAKWDVNAFDFEGQDNISFSTDNRTATYSFKVSSDSEVSGKYDVILEFPSNVPEGVKVTIDGKIAIVNGSICTVSDVGTFDAGKYEKTHTMQIEVSLFDEDVILNGIDVKVIASQAN